MYNGTLSALIANEASVDESSSRDGRLGGIVFFKNKINLLLSWDQNTSRLRRKAIPKLPTPQLNLLPGIKKLLALYRAQAQNNVR